jgi:hypothetical protein
MLTATYDMHYGNAREYSNLNYVEELLLQAQPSPTTLEMNTKRYVEAHYNWKRKNLLHIRKKFRKKSRKVEKLL